MTPLIDIISQSYRLARVIKWAGQGLSESEQAEGLHIFNAMMDGLRIRRCFVYQVVRTVMDVSVGKQDYLVGSLEAGADWVIDRPDQIYRAGFLTGASTSISEIPMDVLIEYTQWASLVCKQVTSSQPRVLYYRVSLQGGQNLGTASVWPVPQTNSQIVIYTPAVVLEFTDINQQLELPYGYRRFLEYVGACQVHDRYPHLPMTPGVEARAREYTSDVMANQLIPSLIRCDGGALQGRADNRRWFDARTWLP